MKKQFYSALALSVSLALGSAQAAEKWQVDAPQGEFFDAKVSVEQGTWMNVDVSPDGNTIVFDLLGDIYTCLLYTSDAADE